MLALHAMDSCRSKRGASQDRQVGFPKQGIWAALSPAAPHPASSSMSKVRSFQCFRELEYDRNSLHGQLPVALSPAASSPIQAAPGYRYHQYQMHEQEVADHRYHRMRHGQSAPMDVLPPLQWSCRKQRGREERKKCRDTDEKEEEEEVVEALSISMRGRPRRGCGKGEAEEEEEEQEEEEEERLPPHELLAREWAASTSSGGAAFSLCQGVGRTLKGNDLLRVRNAILKQTGFI